MLDIEQGQREEKNLHLEQAVKEFEDFFFASNRGRIYKLILEAVEKSMIESALDKTDGNKCKAARILGINRNTLNSKIKKLRIEVRKWRRY